MLKHCLHCGCKAIIAGIFSVVLTGLLYWLLMMQIYQQGNIQHIPNAAYVLDAVIILSLFLSNYLMMSHIYHIKDYK